jgi:hypothetical protein
MNKMATEYKDTAGNTLRETSSGWEILQKGVGWREFIGMTVLALPDGRIIDTRPAQTMPQDVIDQSQHQKQLEDNLFRHYAGLSMQSIIQIPSGYDMESSEMAAASCRDAQAMIDELKKRGRL